MSVEHVRAFNERRVGSERLYLLLDPLTEHHGENSLAPAALHRSLPDGALTTVRRQDLAHTPALCPLLVDIGSLSADSGDALLVKSSVYASGEDGRSRRYVAGWLISALDGEGLAEHLASMCRMKDAAGGSHFFPMHEPLRIELLAVADRGYARQQLGPIREWLLPASSGGVVLMTGKNDTNGALPVPPVALQAQQEAQRVAMVLSAWRAVTRRKTGGAPWSGKSIEQRPANAARDALVQIRTATNQLRLRKNDDIVTFAVHSLVRHPKIHQDLLIAGLIDRASKGEEALIDLFTEVHEARWTYIVSSLLNARTAQ